MARSYTRRSRGEGSVYETAEGRWRASLVVTHPDSGRSVRRVVSGRTRADAVRKLDALKGEAAQGFASGETTGTFLARWVETVRPRLRPSTHREYVRHVTGHFASLSPVPLTKLSPGHVERAMAALLAGGLSAQTVRHARSSLRRALHDAQRDGLIARNVAALARPPRLERRELRALTVAEVRAFVAATADDPLGPAFAVAIGTGLRRGELLALRWTDVDLTGRSLVVRRSLARTADGSYAAAEPKTPRSRRTVMLPAVALDGFLRQRDAQNVTRDALGSAWQDREGLVFTDPVGRLMDPEWMSKQFRTAADRLGLPVRLHDLRHAAASLMLSAGVPLKVVSETLGHASIAITADVYAHVTPELRREAASAMDRALGAGE